MEMRLSSRNLFIYIRTEQTNIVSSTRFEKGYSITLIFGVCHYGYTQTIVPLSFDLFIRAKFHGLVRAPV